MVGYLRAGFICPELSQKGLKRRQPHLGISFQSFEDFSCCFGGDFEPILPSTEGVVVGLVASDEIRPITFSYKSSITTNGARTLWHFAYCKLIKHADVLLIIIFLNVFLITDITK